MNIRLPVTLVAFFLLFTAQQAAAKCYEEKVVETAIGCTKDSSKSADFSMGCTGGKTEIVKVEVDCPQRWVNVPNATGTVSHAAICISAGLSTARISGYTCASGENRPSEGERAGNINYRYGTKSDGPGGTSISTYTKSYNTGGCSPNSSGSCMDVRETDTYCYRSGQSRDYLNTDKIVAVACE